jgi:hypothetical protein
VTFDDPWIVEDDTDILDQVCLVEIPPAVLQTTADEWGLGNSATTVTPEYVTVQCMEIPERLFIDRTEGLTQAVSIGLVVKDTDSVIMKERRIQYRSRRYQVKTIIAPAQHDLKRVLLAEIGSGGN